jgi:hypothetical protein
METIFSDCAIINLEEDYYSPGVFLKVKKPNDFAERDLSKLELDNIAIITQASVHYCRFINETHSGTRDVSPARLERHVTPSI